MTAVFMPDDSLFIQVYHRIKCKNYHFTYDWKSPEPKASEPVIHQMVNSSSRLNFPLNTFESHEHDELLTFFRQGEVIRVSCKDISDYSFETVTRSNDLGNIYLIENEKDQVLASSTSSSVIFYRSKRKCSSKNKTWRESDRIPEVRGQIYYRADKRIF